MTLLEVGNLSRAAELGNTTLQTVTPGLMERQPHITIFMLILYSLIFVIGMFGNVLVLYVVIRNKSMRTITNKFIACLSVSDLLICLFAIPFTPINALIKSWVFGDTMCKLVPVILLISVFVSTLTSVVIALDRYLAIVYPHTKRMSPKLQMCIIIFIWILAASAAVPIFIFTSIEIKVEPNIYDCQERWPNNKAGSVYSWTIFTLQMVIPAVIITICYATISIQLHQRAQKRFSNSIRNPKNEQQDIRRNRRINKMLIAMIVIFIICWLPLNIIYTTMDMELIPEKQFLTIFLFMHILAMSSVIYNPFLYGWMNESFNNHFREIWRQVFPCCYKRQDYNSSASNDQSNGSQHKTRLCSKQSNTPGSPVTSVVELRAIIPEVQHDETDPFLQPNNGYSTDKHHTNAEEQASYSLLSEQSVQEKYTS